MLIDNCKANKLTKYNSNGDTGKKRPQSVQNDSNLDTPNAKRLKMTSGPSTHPIPIPIPVPDPVNGPNTLSSGRLSTPQPSNFNVEHSNTPATPPTPPPNQLANRPRTQGVGNQNTDVIMKSIDEEEDIDAEGVADNGEEIPQGMEYYF